MATYLSNELANDTTGTTTTAPVGFRPAANLVGARTKAFRATITYASQAAGTVFVLGKIPAGAAFAYGVITVGTSTGSTTISVGDAADSATYKALAAHTSTDAPALFGKAAAITAAPNTADVTITATTAAATLPSSGTAVIEIFFTSAN